MKPTDGYYPAPSPRPVTLQPTEYSWTGVYFGLHGGGAWGDISLTETNPGRFVFVPPLAESFTQNLSSGGGFGGVQLELNRQLGHWVVGGQLALSGAHLKGSAESCFGPFAAFVTASCEAEIHWLFTMLARAGYAQDRWLVYGAAGWSLAGVEAKETSLSPLAFPASAAISETADGFTFGAGVEFAVSDFVSVGAEYLHADLHSGGNGLQEAFFSQFNLSPGEGERRIDLDTVSARINFKMTP